MNLEKINDLTTIAARLADAGSAANGVIHRVVGMIDKELDADQPRAQDEELAALKSSNDIKQANLNLLARNVLEICDGKAATHGALRDLKSLAKDLIQEEQCATEASYNGCAAQGDKPVDPVAQVVENLKRARAEVLRLIELRRQTSFQDTEVADAHAEACRAVDAFKGELIKAIDAQLK